MARNIRNVLLSQKRVFFLSNRFYTYSSYKLRTEGNYLALTTVEILPTKYSSVTSIY